MKINPKYLVYQDLIGLYTLAKPKSKSREKKNFQDIGIIIDESKNMVITEKDNIIKNYIKKDHIFRFKLPEEKDKMLEVNGNRIVGRPENRLRSLRKKRWIR